MKGMMLENKFSEEVVMKLFYKHRLKKVDELISMWEGSDAWKGEDLRECLNHLNAIKEIISSRIKGGLK